MSDFREQGEIPAAGNAEPRYVSTMQVAKALGVSVSTVKRWVDEGTLAAHRTLGGHRKLLMADVVRLVREGNLPHADLRQLLPNADAVDWSDLSAVLESLWAALRECNADAVRGIIHGAYGQGLALETLADRVIAPAMWRLGKEWEAGKIQVFHEHRATQAVVAALYELKSRLRAPVPDDAPVAVGGAPEGDHSILPSLLAKLVLRENGWDAVNLGPHTPLRAFHTALVDLKPRLIWLSASHLVDPEQFVKEYSAFYRHAQDRDVPIAIGGNALNETIRCQLPYTTFGDGLTHLAAFAKSLRRGA
jgi:excisionase family DNA binding protein